MLARMRPLVLAFAIAALLSGCGGDDNTFEDLDAPLVVEAGEAFAIALSENPSTGYEWQFTRRPDPEVARFVGSDFELEEGGEDRDGAGGTRRFRFEAVAAGETEMRLRYLFTGAGRNGRVQSTQRVVLRVR
jgi:predicted secreted protein